jgi:hypothetical protein
MEGCVKGSDWGIRTGGDTEEGAHAFDGNPVRLLALENGASWVFREDKGRGLAVSHHRAKSN